MKMPSMKATDTDADGMTNIETDPQKIDVLGTDIPLSSRFTILLYY